MRSLLLTLALASLGGCEALRAVVAPESPPPPEVLATLPLPDGAVIASASCVGTPQTEGYGCVVQADAPVPLGEGAAAADARMSGWEAVSGDWIPDREQRSWARGDERVALALHAQAGGSHWALSYTWTKEPAPTPRFDEDTLADPRAKRSKLLESLPVPEGASLLRSQSLPGSAIASEQWSVSGDPAAILSLYEGLAGSAVVFRSWSPGHRVLSWRDGPAVRTATLWLGEAGEHVLVLANRP